jgi:hypothetical protein
MGGFMGIGKKILSELVRRADTTAPLLYLDAVNLAASQEIEVLRAEGCAIRGSPENIRVPKAAKVYQVQDVPERGLTERRKNNWSTVVQERYRLKPCFKCGGNHGRPGICDGPGSIIILSDHIKRKEQINKVKGSAGTIVDGYSLSNFVVMASDVDESAVESGNIPFNKVINCESLLSQRFFSKHIELSEEAEAQRTRKGGPNTWEERKAQWTDKFPTKQRYPKKSKLIPTYSRKCKAPSRSYLRVHLQASYRRFWLISGAQLWS